ncbi:ankyrin repeat domain-containing protein [Brachyspira hyodysenteriae]|uniref:ankyrin repeat domain-containing protein n=1 Tax=Brachyspira hyodysenteriae TaxID=159 RepID=UPI00063DAC57|nr:ankyrin repeat domain-containing protein [Brachyspira hyodysenteriae]KLI48844.1 ankyrin [Brachyspira hyodysenteriae]MCZ9888513.1 ankyrin repeat domain-containing protein [Brachyspira hyodysenteriae]MCZ9960843.1 ankyrin repeat domain-containing protein [Brachyspira hyodysenteriae]
MKNIISIISIFVLMVSIISCGGGNKETEQTENTQINQTETNKVYVNPTSTNENHNTDVDINFDTTKYTNEYIQGTEMYPMPTGYKKIDEILNEHKYKAPIYEISELLAEEGLEGKITEMTNFGDKYIFKDSTPLFLAVQFGYNDLAKELIKEGADVNARVDNMETEGGIDMLYYAVINNNPEMTKILIDKGLDKNRDYGYEYSTYLTDIAIGNNNLDILKLLVKRGDSKETLIPKAVQENNIEMVKYLLSIGQDIDAQRFFDGFWVDSPLKVAAENGYIEMAKFLIDEGANLNSADDYMLYAYNNYDITKLLVDNDVFNLNTNTTREEAIKLVKDGKYYEIEKLLLSEDSNNIDGYDELMNAISKGDMKALEKLVKDDTDLNKQYDKITPLGLAAARNDKEMVKFLVEKGADINLEDGYGYTPLIIAMKYRNIGLAKDIIDLKPDLNAICSATGDTPLTYLVDKVKFGSDICYYLIKNGADVNKKNNNGDTPLIVSVQNFILSYGMLGVLINMGADYNIKNKEGKTAMDIVIEKDDKATLHHLNNPDDLEYYLTI